MRPLTKIAILGSFPPRQCGIATFSSDLGRALIDSNDQLTVESIAMSDRADYTYSSQVGMEVPALDHSCYEHAARFVNRGSYDILSIQHEYGIFGGDSGAYLLSMIRNVNIPIVTTLHTVLEKPSASQRVVLDELLMRSTRIVVMSQKAVGFLTQVHKVSLDKIVMIPHGIPVVPHSDRDEVRQRLGISGPFILTFGLLSPDKGIQYVISAMPQIVAEHPGACYVVVGATHPHVRKSAGEAYRESLVKLAEDAGAADCVRFIDRFVSSEELVGYLSAMDIYVTPYLNPHQITSGTLAYSVGAGKAVISTPYWYAEELLAEGRGLLVPFRDSTAIAEAVLQLQGDAVGREEMGRRASEFGQHMLWPEVGRQYINCFRDAIAEGSLVAKKTAVYGSTQSVRLRMTPDLKLTHLFDLSDDTGILQHATFTVPNRSEGYCVDDNARALLLTAFLETLGVLSEERTLLQSRYLSFVLDAYNAETGRFRNFMSYDRRWLEDSGSEDSQGRALWSLGAIANRCTDRGRREVAKSLFELAAPGLFASTSPRTWAYAILGGCEYLLSFPQELKIQSLVEIMAERLMTQYEASYSLDWPWFEQSLCYANARLSQALIAAGVALSRNAMVEVGVASLTWLMKLQTGPEGVFCPIGSNGFYARFQTQARFDQQPIEAWASLSACLLADRVTGNPLWLGEANRSFDWFLGLNMRSEPLYDKVSGGCHDGLHIDRVNRNQGAESTLSFLCALAEIKAKERVSTSYATVSVAHQTLPLRSSA